MVNLQRPKLTEVIATQKTILDLAGINKSKKNKLFHDFILMIILLTCLLANLSLYIQFVIDMEDFKKAFSCLNIIIQMLAYTSKLLNYLMKREVVEELHEMLDDPLMSDYQEKYDETLRNNIRTFRIINRAYRGASYVIMSLLLISPPLQKDPKRPLMFPSYFGVDPWEHQMFCACCQTYLHLVASVVNISLDLYFNGMLKIASFHFEILGEELREVEGEEGEIRRRLKYCVRQHVFLMDFAGRLGSLMSFGILVQFACSIGVICTTGIELFMVENSLAEISELVNFFFCMFLECSLYCWFGNELTMKSRAISEACYTSKWYGYSPGMRKMLALIMERAKRPVQVKAANFIVLSIATLAAILSKAYSFFAILRTVLKDSKNPRF